MPLANWQLTQQLHLPLPQLHRQQVGCPGGKTNSMDALFFATIAAKFRYIHLCSHTFKAHTSGLSLSFGHHWNLFISCSSVGCRLFQAAIKAKGKL
uniref:Triphosphoribosyl-dephospho-CoA synthase n=1 Tax=Panagrellus redivivus TaxID=6233 RepID=A0A7E4V9C7_PANRE